MPEYVDDELYLMHQGDLQKTSVDNLGNAAEIARDKGRRLVTVPGLVQLFGRDVYADSAGVHSVEHYGRAQEAVEIRLEANMTLCYGGTGVHSFTTANFYNILQPKTIGGTVYYVGHQINAGSSDPSGNYDSNVVDVVLTESGNPSHSTR